MKILLVHNKYQANNVGGEDVVYQSELTLLREMMGTTNVFNYDLSNDKINKFKLIFSIWYSFKHYLAIKRIVKTEAIDIVHVHNFFPLLTPSVFSAAKRAGAKVILTLHNYRLWCMAGIFYRSDIGVCEQCVGHKLPLFGIVNKCYRKSRLQSILAQLALSFYQWRGFYRQIDYFFVLTPFQQQKVIALGIEPARVLLKPNGVARLTYAHTSRRGYIFIGRLEDNKGIYEVLRCWQTLDKTIGLTIIGNGDELEELRQQYQAYANIKFMGSCSREETLKLLAQSRYLIQASLLYETFGLTIIEAFMLGVPVIGFKRGTRPDFIKSRINGFLAEEVSKLRECILESASCSAETYQELSRNAQATYADFELNSIGVRQIQKYQDILSEKVVTP